MSLFGIIVVPVGVCGFVHGRAASCGAKLEGWKGVRVCGRARAFFFFDVGKKNIFARTGWSRVKARDRYQLWYGMVPYLHYILCCT